MQSSQNYTTDINYHETRSAREGIGGGGGGGELKGEAQELLKIVLVKAEDEILGRKS